MIIFRKTVDFEFDFMDRAPLLQDCPELHHWLFQNGSSVNRDFAFNIAREIIIYSTYLLYIWINTLIQIYVSICIYIYMYLFTHTHMFVEFGKSIRNSDQTF